MGEQSPVQQTGPKVALDETALRLELDDGVRPADRVHTEGAHLQAGLS